MPRQATRAVDRLKQPVKKAALAGLDRASLEDEPLLTGLSELQTKQVRLRSSAACHLLPSAWYR